MIEKEIEMVVDNLINLAIKNFNESGGITPVFFTMTRDRRVSIIPLEYDDKDKTELMMRVAVKQLQPIATLYITEAYRKIVSKDEKIDTTIPIKDQKGSVEIVIFSMETKKDTKQMIIEIPENRQIEMGKWVIMKGFEGRFVNLIYKIPQDDVAFA